VSRPGRVRFVLVPDGEEVRCEKAFVCNRRVGQIHFSDMLA
jgi:hypothetical protein